MSPTAKRVARVVGTVALLAVTLWWVDLDGVVVVLSKARLGPLGVALALSVPLLFVMALRWQFTARRMGVDVSLWAALREYYASTLLNQVLPGGVVGDISRAIRAGQRNPHTRGLAARSVVFERVSGQLVLWTTLVVGVTLWRAEAMEASRLGLGATAVGAVVAAVVLLPRVPGIADSRLGRAWQQGLDEARGAFIDRGAWAVQLALSSLSIALLVGMYAACIRAVGAEVGLGQLMLIAPALLVVTSLPVSVGGWGVREAASLALFEMEGLDPAAGVAASAALGAVSLVAVLPGLWFALRPTRA